ncbi:MAG: transposase, partial [Candidatus Omnitrophica bacterium]|nr:transposase [Candidatus Omnitrophota bacterium]
MPDHSDGIIIINNPVGNGPARSVNKNNNLSVIIGSYKSTVTKQINRINNIVFQWQKSFHDHIIRTTDSLKNIREYIANNP